MMILKIYSFRVKLVNFSFCMFCYDRNSSAVFRGLYRPINCSCTGTQKLKFTKDPGNEIPETKRPRVVLEHKVNKIIINKS